MHRLYIQTCPQIGQCRGLGPTKNQGWLALTNTSLRFRFLLQVHINWPVNGIPEYIPIPLCTVKPR